MVRAREFIARRARDESVSGSVLGLPGLVILSERLVEAFGNEDMKSRLGRVVSLSL
jgi:hypothetical protein